MTMLREAAQQALEAIRIFREWEMGQDYHSNRETVLARAFAAEETLEAALAEPVQEPVAWISESENLLSWDKFYDHMKPLYTHPPQRKPLTTQQILDLFDSHNVYGSKWVEFARAIEEAVWEKNHG